jgi:hypothetical protein
LAKDRFKRKERVQSSTEHVLLKRMMNKGPSGPTVNTKVDEFADLWNSPLEQSKKRQSFRDFTNSTAVKVKAVITPHSGQSANPSASSHGEILKKVVREEEQEIEKNFKGTIKQHAMATVTDYPSQSESESEFEKEEFQGRPVERERKKTQTEINRKVSHGDLTLKVTSQSEQIHSRRVDQAEET